MNDAFEYLSPSQPMSLFLSDLRGALDELAGSDATPCAAYRWDDIPFEEFSLRLARFALWEIDRDYDVDDLDAAPGERDILHRLSIHYDIASEKDLDRHFWNHLDGRSTSYHYERIYNAPTLQDLLKSDMEIGWEGFEGVGFQVAAERTRLSRLRMLVDYFRHTYNPSFTRSYDISQAAALVAETIQVDMLTPAKVSFLLSRTAGETALRYKSWHEFAQSLLFAKAFTALNFGIDSARSTMDADLPVLKTLLSGIWGDFAWPRIKSFDPMPTPIP